MLSLLLPERCLHCENPTRAATGVQDTPLSHYLCGVCERIVASDEPPREEVIRDRLQRTAPHLVFESCSTAFNFHKESPLQAVVHAFKYQGMERLAALAGRFAVDRIAKFDPSALITPIPLHRTRLAERGYNQATALAHGMVAAAKIEPRLLRRIRATDTQALLTAHERYENVRGAFALGRDSSVLRNRKLILIDDVMTTGATLASAAETLLDAGPASISIVTLAAASTP